MDAFDWKMTHGLANFEAGAFRDSLECFRAAIAIKRSDAADDALRRLAYEALRRAMGGAQGPAAAEEDYRLCIEAYAIVGEAISPPNDRQILAMACYNLASHYKLGDRLEEALSLYREALALWPDNPIAINLGELLTTMGRAREALPILRAASPDGPEALALQRNLINTLYEAGETAAAVAATQAAVGRFPAMRFQHRAMFCRIWREGKMVSA